MRYYLLIALWQCCLLVAPPSSRAQATPIPEEVYNLVWNAADRGDVPRALFLCDSFLAAQPDLLLLHNTKGKILFDEALSMAGHPKVLSKIRMAITEYHWALQTPGLSLIQKSEFFVNIGAAYGTLGELDSALTYLEKGIVADSGNKNAYFNRSLVYYNLKEYEKAVTDMDKVLALDPDNAELWYESGMLQRYLGHNKNAVSRLTKAIQLKPDFGLAYLERARAHKNRHKRKAAGKDYDKAVQLGVQLEEWDR